MKNKKLKFIVAGLAISSLVVGGTFAWLGANDSVKNVFLTETSQKSGVRVDEDFDNDNAEEMKTGESQAVKKQVRVQNTSDYNSLIRARIELEMKFTDENGDVHDITDELSQYVNYTYSSHVSLDGTNTSVGTWTYNQDGYFYYIGNIAPDYYTNNILEKVWLSPEISKNETYKSIKNIDFQVNVIAEGVPSTIEGITSKGTEIDTETGKEYALGFGLEGDGALITALRNIITVDSKADSSLSGGFAQKQQ